MSQNIQLHLEQARIENKSYEEFLLELLQYEVQLRHQNGILSRIRNAKFPYQKTLEELDVRRFTSRGSVSISSIM